MNDQRIKTVHLIRRRLVTCRNLHIHPTRQKELPFVLPRKHRSVNILVEHEHRNIGQEVQILMKKLKEKYL